MLCWSNSNNRPFLFDRSDGKSGIFIEKEVNASFFDHLTVTPQNRQNGQKDLSWIWSWQMDSRTGYGPNNILNDETFEGKLTVRGLCEAIEDRLRGYPVGALTEQLM